MHCYSGPFFILGHYIAYIKDRTKDTWLKCDDSKVKEVDLSAALCDSTKACYILVYEAVDDVEMESVGEMDEENGRDASEEEVEQDQPMQMSSPDSKDSGTCTLRRY